MSVEMALLDAAPRLRTGTSGDSLLNVASACESLSPSLRVWTPGTPDPYEMKFLLDEQQAREVERRLQGSLTLDPHAAAELSQAYRVTTLYCDTPARDVFHRVGRHQRRKYRLRRYGGETVVFLERKNKRGNRVRKQRTTVRGDELALLTQPSLAEEWSGKWFAQQVARHSLSPACLVEYQRTAYVGNCDSGPLRLTFDRHLRGKIAQDWNLTAEGDYHLLLSGPVICEFKYRGAMPPMYKGVIQALQLSPCGVSKYRHALRELEALAQGSLDA